MMLQDRLNQIKRTTPGGKTLGQLLPEANAADGRAEIGVAKNRGIASLSFKDIGDHPPAPSIPARIAANHG
jgi:hypothetical protein